MPNIYETDRLLAEYLLFHYGREQEILDHGWHLRDALHFPGRCAAECIDPASFPANATALDVGCAVGRASFELARHCASVTGIDFSHRFIEAANVLKQTGEHPYARADEGSRTIPCVALVPSDVERDRLTFEVGDATNLRADLGAFDIVLAANLLCRLPDPAKFLARLPSLVKPGGRLVITTPCTWMEEFTPRAKWLCESATGAATTLDGLLGHLAPYFDLIKQSDLPFVIREHARKFQWTVAQCTVWTRKAL